MYKYTVLAEIAYLASDVERSLGISTRLMKFSELVQIADNNNDVRLGALCRMLLIREEQLSPKLVYGFQAFAWVLDAREKDVTIVDYVNFFHIYKWIVAAGIGISRFSIEELEGLFEQFKEALNEGGFSLRSYYHVKALYYLHLRNVEKVREVLAFLRDLVVDEVSDNALFETSVEVYCCLFEGKLDEAVLIARPLFEYEETAYETFCLLAFEFFKLDTEKCYEYHALALAHRRKEHYNEYVSDLTGRLIDMYLSFVKGYTSCWTAFMGFKLAERDASEVYSLQVSKYLAAMLVSLGDFYKETSGLYISDELQQHELLYYKNRAFDLAKRFDERNKVTDYYGRTLRFFKKTGVCNEEV